MFLGILMSLLVWIILGRLLDLLYFRVFDIFTDLECVFRTVFCLGLRYLVFAFYECFLVCLICFDVWFVGIGFGGWYKTQIWGNFGYLLDL